jgi:N-acetylglucosamine-6-phosphate deacetylase
MLAVKNGKFIVKDRIESGKALLFTNRILAFVNEEDIPEDTEVIDANGGYVSPGFIDLHIHG